MPLPECYWLDIRNATLNPSLVLAVSSFLPLLVWSLSGSLRLSSPSWTDVEETLLPTSPMYITKSLKRSLYALVFSSFLQILFFIIIQLITQVQNTNVLWMVRVSFLLGLRCLLWNLLLYYDYATAQAVSFKKLKQIHSASIRVSLFVWFVSLVEAYHFIKWYGLTDPVCFLDPLLYNNEYWLFFFSLQLLCLMAFSFSLIPQSRLLLEVEYERLSSDLRYKPPKSLKEFSMHFAKLIPFIWPQGENKWRLRAFMLFSFLVMATGRFVNVMVPIQYKKVIDALSQLPVDSKSFKSSNLFSIMSSSLTNPIFPWSHILFFVFFRFLAGNSGALQSLQSFLWIPVGQYTTREISVQMLRHLHR
jgi:hypothetical protein